MSTDIPDPRPDDVEIVGRSGPDHDDALWGPVPREQRIAWLRVAAQNWPFHPGAAVGGLTNAALAEGRLVHSASLIGVARDAFEADFTPDEYQLLRRLILWRVPAHLVTRRDRRDRFADDFFGIDARQWRGWLDRIRAGEPAEVATIRFLAGQRRQESEDNSWEPDANAEDGMDSRFGTGPSTMGGWGIPLGGGKDRYGWWRILEVFPPVRPVARTSTGKYRSPAAGEEWGRALNELVDALLAAGFSPQDFYTLCLTLQGLTDDQWARVDKRLFSGEGANTREGWLLTPVPAMWANWPQLVHDRGMLPHEATAHVLGGVWTAPDREETRRGEPMDAVRITKR